MNKWMKPAAGKSVWDERQTQNYHRINSRAFNALRALLLVALLSQVVLYPREPVRWAVEGVLFLLVNAYVAVAYFRAGLWTSTRQQPSTRQNVLGSVAAALLVTMAVVVRMGIAGRLKALFTAGEAWPAWRYLLVQAVIVFVVALGALTLVGKLFRKKQRQTEDSLDDA